MAMIKDVAVVLRKLDYSENSQVLAVFTRAHGKARVLAKGIKRSTRARFAVAVDQLDIGHIVLSVKQARQASLAIVSEWTQTHVLSDLRTRLDRLYGAQYAAGLTADLTEDWDPHPGLYDALVGTLEALAESGDTLPVVVHFQRRLLVEVGSAPIFDACVGCRRVAPEGGELHFSALEGGLLCRDCEPARMEKRHLDRGALPWLRGRAGDPARLPAAYSVLDYHITHLRGRPHPLAQSYLAACPR